MLEPFLSLFLGPTGPYLGRRQTHLLRRRDVDLDLRPLPKAQEDRRLLDHGDVKLPDLTRLAVSLPLERRKREVFGDLVQTQVATP